jgi:hypothetical protein
MALQGHAAAGDPEAEGQDRLEAVFRDKAVASLELGVVEQLDASTEQRMVRELPTVELHPPDRNPRPAARASATPGRHGSERCGRDRARPQRRKWLASWTSRRFLRHIETTVMAGRRAIRR